MDTTLVPISELKLDPANPRKITEHDFKALVTSLKEFGWVQPVIVNTRTGLVVGGHQRIRAAVILHMTEAPVLYVDLSEAQQKALNVGLNRISGDWDSQLLIELLEGLDDDMKALTGFDDAELSRLLDDPFSEEGEADDKPKLTEPRYTIGQLKTLARNLYPEQADELLEFFDRVERDSGEL